MKFIKITKYILLTGLTVLVLCVTPLFADEVSEEGIDPIQAAESGILARLNLARSDLWAEAEQLGLDPEVLRAEIAWEKKPEKEVWTAGRRLHRALRGTLGAGQGDRPG